jgi:PAS domain S-box-containing protein
MTSALLPPTASQANRTQAAILELVTLSTSDQTAHHDVIDLLLKRTQDYFDLDLAIVSRIEGAKYFVEHVLDPGGDVVAGTELNLCDTYCERVVTLSRPILVDHVADSLFSSHPCYERMPLETYVGVRLFVKGRVYGTLNLSSSDPRAGAFTSLDTSVLETAASLISHHLSLDEAEERYEAAVRGSSVGLWDWNVRTDELYWSPRFLEIVGLDAADYKPTFAEFSDRLHPDDKDRVLLAVSAHLSDRVPYDIEYRLRHESGDYIWIHARGQGVWARDRNPVRMAGSVDDITSRRAAEETARIAEQRYHLAIAGANAGIWDWDIVSDRHYWSRRFLDMLGMEHDKAAAERPIFLDRLHPDDRSDVEAALADHVKNRVPLGLQCRLRHEDGRWIHVRATGQAIWDESGRAVRMAGSVEDITSQIEAAETLRSKTEELTRTNQELENFAFIASHDLQEPLRKISAYGELLQRGYAERLDDRGRQIVHVMTDGASRMQQLILDLLRYSKSSNVEMTLAAVDLNEVIAGVERDLDVSIRETGAQIEYSELPVLAGDPTLLRQLFQNLISNSIKYRGDTIPHILIAARSLGPDQTGMWEIRVTDNGIGFRPEFATRIFEIFRRLHGKGKYPGTGIGLALCQRIVERHGGRIRAEGEDGGGACFIVELPASSASS